MRTQCREARAIPRFAEGQSSVGAPAVTVDTPSLVAFLSMPRRCSFVARRSGGGATENSCQNNYSDRT